MNSPGSQSEPTLTAFGWALLFALPLTLHLSQPFPEEPVFNGDANRHVMTSVFFRDMLVDLPTGNPKTYAENYYEQYPALGLLIWPPLFHAFTGLMMLIFGTSAWVARAVTFGSLMLAAFSLFRTCRRRVSAEQAAVVTAVFCLMPMIYLYSRHVMLELPTLALVLLCIDRFDCWLNGSHRHIHGNGTVEKSAGNEQALAPNTEPKHDLRNLYIAAVAAALAALTRFDAVCLLPTLILMVVVSPSKQQFWNRHVLFASVLALAIAGPTYAVIWSEQGALHLRQAVSSVGGEHSSFLAAGCFSFYLSCIPNQAGWVVAVLACIGFFHCLLKDRSGSGPFLALFAGTYLTFTPLAELRARHSIYWLPAIAFFAVTGTIQLLRFIETRTVKRQSRMQTQIGLTVYVYAALFTGTCWSTCHLPEFRVSGYESAAATVLARTQPGEAVLVDGWWDGNFTYHMRHLDPSRSRIVVRGDRIFYDFVNVPDVDFQSFVETDADILAAIAESNVRCIAFEDPQPFGHIPQSEKFRGLVMRLPEIFPPVTAVPASVRFPLASKFTLHVFDVDQQLLDECLREMNSTERTTVFVEGTN